MNKDKLLGFILGCGIAWLIVGIVTIGGWWDA